MGTRSLLPKTVRARSKWCARNSARFHLVLLDLTMPGMSGEQVLPLLREIRKDLPIIVSSGYDKAEAGRRLGHMDVGFLQKPYTAFQLAEKIRGVLGGRDPISTR